MYLCSENPKNSFMDKEKEIISQANEITNSMSPLDLVQKRCFYLIVQQVRKKYIETDQPTKKYENMIINMTSDTLAKARDEKHVTQAFESLAKLRDQYFKIVTKDFKLVVGIINYAKYIEETKMYEVEVSKEIFHVIQPDSRHYPAACQHTAFLRIVQSVQAQGRHEVLHRSGPVT